MVLQHKCVLKYVLSKIDESMDMGCYDKRHHTCTDNVGEQEIKIRMKWGKRRENRKIERWKDRGRCIK